MDAKKRTSLLRNHAVQTLLSIYPIDYTSLQTATNALRSQLQAAGLM